MELIAAVVIGLNPYVGTFVLAALSAFTNHVPVNPAFAGVPGWLLTTAALLAGLAAPFDFVLGKFLRFAPRVRRASQFVAPLFAGLFAARVGQFGLPAPAVAAGAAILAWSVSAMLTSAAARASRSAAWVGLGHVPVLMAATTAAACIVPLALAKPVFGFTLVAITLLALVPATLSQAFARPAPRTETGPRALGRAPIRLARRAVAP